MVSPIEATDVLVIPRSSSYYPSSQTDSVPRRQVLPKRRVRGGMGETASLGGNAALGTTKIGFSLGQGLNSYKLELHIP